METSRSRTIVGSKGGGLSVRDVYNVAYFKSFVEIDPVALDRLSRNSARDLSLRLEDSALGLDSELDLNLDVDLESQRELEEAETRAILVVLIHKLLQSEVKIRKFLLILLAEYLNSGLCTKVHLSVNTRERNIADTVSSMMDDVRVARSTGKVETLRRIRERVLEAGEFDFLLSGTERDALAGSGAVAVGLAALLIHSLSSISVFADAVACLSCEALEANIKAFDGEAYNQTTVNKSESDVASDVRSLLVGSKLVHVANGGLNDESIDLIPFINGVVREEVKVATARIHVEINRVSAKKKEGSALNPSCTSTLSSPLLINSVVSLALTLEPLVWSSVKRLALGLPLINDFEARSGAGALGEAFESLMGERMRLFYKLRTAVTDISKSAGMGTINGVKIMRRAALALEYTCKLLAMEAAGALGLLFLLEANMKSKEKKKKKGPQELGLGKGAAKLQQLLLSLLPMHSPDDVPRSASVPDVESWVTKLGDWLDKGWVLQDFSEKFKTIVESNEVGRLPKIAKGTRDFDPKQMAVREEAFGIITGVFKRHGAVALDTPVFELRETLMGKYGEDSKLIYDLADQGGEILSLRYDLTVPFARYIAMHKVEKMKRYHIARVYRRDNPAKGRYREFYQCDFDIAGTDYPSMVPDFEVLKVLTELLDELGIGDYQVKLNHRRLLDGMLDVCGVPSSKFRSICSAIDKLDKLKWEDVKKEMVEEKGLPEESADKIGKLVSTKGEPMEVLRILQQEGSPYIANAGSMSALKELDLLFHYLQSANCLHRISFDLSLARGLDYYTGVIYEAVFKGSITVGSIAAGGRYDNLVGMFSKQQVPAVGVSLGIERVFAIMEKQLEDGMRQGIRETQTEVIVMGIGEAIMEDLIALTAELWAGKIKAEVTCCTQRNLAKQIMRAGSMSIPWMIFVGSDDLEKRVVQLKDLAAKVQEAIPRDRVVEELQLRLGNLR